jgi:hypothetical protein
MPEAKREIQRQLWIERIIRTFPVQKGAPDFIN